MITLPRVMFLALLLVGGYVFVVAPRVEAETTSSARWEEKVAEPVPTFRLLVRPSFSAYVAAWLTDALEA